ncbi:MULTISPECIES: hypothetical protein [Nostoc]|uniref:Uncharacterized protein n=1 Tax=Nostoc paludosum FACHB-159 TaxID=2692908 RepID=A0ABR8KIX9_9NOSO|nr:MULTISPECIES: hypothetical protein [Nostoc]MBD2681916.1 hypothetical protein [Nostoc sp. FACHB-857]MBD2738255.1 hypothetical protein [Nostoc paludosum FACHB-159]
MNKNKITLFTVLALIGTVLGACQSDGDKVAQTDNNYPAKLTDVQTLKDKEVQEQIRQYVEETPDLYRISWKVCGDWNAPYKDGTRCNETRIPRTKGYFEPVYVWGANGVQFVNKQDFVRNFWTTGLFVQSTGCLILGKPREESLYNVKNFMLQKTSTTPTAENVKVEVLSKQEKQTVVEQAFKDAEVENYALTNFGVSATTGMIPTGKSCLNFEEWKKTQF